MDEFHKAGHLKYAVGPGGFKCACCADPPPYRKKRMKKLARKYLKDQLRKELRNEKEYYSNG